MVRKIILTAAAVALIPAAALANEPAAKATDRSSTTNSTTQAVLDSAAAELEARQHLERQGYTNISSLERDANGRWTGTASKDGKTTVVAIDLRKPPKDAPSSGTN